jgi:hypothetical protein
MVDLVMAEGPWNDSMGYRWLPLVVQSVAFEVCTAVSVLESRWRG